MARSEKLLVSTRPDGEKGLFATQDVAENEVLITYDGPIVDHSTRLSIQIDDDKHIEGTEDSNAFLNHGCDPTAYVDWNELCLRARRTILVGEEITCNYFTTDYDLCEKFTCTCGSPMCKGEIKGFKYLSKEEQQELEPWLPPFLKPKLQGG
ncbi:MAG TPA: SET domain-containing protein-lysine N-methyltransferase [Terriglobales bacterium]|jgi:hypothetical protein|nr:SET domain-containing protein-lysine N-methyltransferase [Terriglobales bacterium]